MIQIIPAIDLRGGKCVRLRQGDYAAETVFGDDPVPIARRWAEAGATRLHLVDLDGAKAGRPQNGTVIRNIATELTIPCQLGGGLRDDAALDEAFNELRVDRVIIGTAALKNPDWFRAAAERRPHRLLLGLDARDGRVATEGWLDVSETAAVDLARQFDHAPIAGIIYTNIANDGMMQGIDDGTLADLAELAAGPHPVIASGGVTTLDDVRRLVALAAKHPKVAGAIVGRSLYEGRLDLAEAIRVGLEGK
ncbi:MAG TPA: 1-(5-phosphoribosyl)-5-[(5-phosphoribosylamino)methylideneamino]imidazole-4-carboxamide isomerase [Planctomycetaceae bacterium]